MTRQQCAYLYAVTTVLMWSTVAAAFKLTLRHLSPIPLLFYANIVSIVCLLLVLAGQNRVSILLQYSRRDVARCAILGFLNPFLYYLILIKAYDLLPAQEAQPLNYTWAITLAILSVPLLGQKLTAKDIVAILISYFGVIVIATRGEPWSLRFANTAGVMLALGSTVIWALYWIFNMKAGNDPVANLLLNFIFGLPFVALATCLLSDPFAVSVQGLVGAAYIGLFEMGIAFVLWLNALKLSDSTARVSNLIFFSPFLSLVFISVFVGEKISPSSIAGLVLIVVGNVIQRYKGR